MAASMAGSGRESSGGAAPSSPAGPGPAERVLSALKPFARIAWEECREPLPDAGGSAAIRWEIYSTWTLLLCLRHAEAEAERCARAGWRPGPWKTEAGALRHVFLQSPSVRALGAVLRWLRWAHRWSVDADAMSAVEEPGRAPGARPEAPEAPAAAGYERTLRALKLQSALDAGAPLQAAPAMHPDGPLQQRSRFDGADLEDEERLLRRVFHALRRGDLRGALRACAEGGQAWRTAMLQGMLPYAEEPPAGLDSKLPGYDADAEEEDEEMLAVLKEDHTDWTEVGALERPGTNNGNPWRRLWKEQCWDTAQRQLQGPASSMALQELAIYGFCSGHVDALLLACGGSWADRCWGELHCLKEWLVERLLDLGREEWCKPGVYLGEGDSGVPDALETPESRAARRDKLCGPLRETAAADLEVTVGAEVHRLLACLADAWLPTSSVCGPPAQAFIALRSALVRAAWAPESGHEALAILRQWLTEGLGGAPCPFLVKQFASHFAIWQKEVLEEHRRGSRGGDADGDGDAAMGAAGGDDGEGGLDVDDIVCELVVELVDVAASAWEAQILDGQAAELIAELVSALRLETRLGAFSSLLLRLGDPAAATASGAAGAAAAATSPARCEALKRCLWVFWGRFPEDAFALLVQVVRRALRLDAGPAAELTLVGEEQVLELGTETTCPVGAASDVSLAVLCIVLFWVVLRDKAGEPGPGPAAALAGLERLLGAGGPPLLEGSRPVGGDAFARLALDAVALPLLADALLTLMATAPEGARALFSFVLDSALWRDAFTCGSPGVQALAELEWFMGLCDRQAAWSAAKAAVSEQRRPDARRASRLGRPPWSGSDSAEPEKAEHRVSAARDALLDWARPRLAMDRPLLEPPPGLHTSLPDPTWQHLRGTLTCRVLFILLSVFEGTSDFDGALSDLAVAAAQSPWMLQGLTPAHARAFLERLALLPTRPDGEQFRVALDPIC